MSPENKPDTVSRPTFLSTRVYIDFRRDSEYEERYAELIYEIHEKNVRVRPPLGPNPFDSSQYSEQVTNLSFSPERYVSPGLTGKVTFDYSNNNGRFIIGSGQLAFETAWSGGSNRSIHAYSDPPNIESVSLAVGVDKIHQIDNALEFDTSSRVRSPRVGEIVIWKNKQGFFAATRLDQVQSRSHGKTVDEVAFTYTIQPDRTASFKKSRTDA